MYLLKIDGISGDSTVRGFEGWFTLESYRWEVDGAAGGKTAGLPLTVAYSTVAGLIAVEKKAATGARLARIELQVVGGAPSRPNEWSFKIVLADPLVTPTAMAWNEGELSTSWSFSDYSRADVSSRSTDNTGQWSPISSAAWVR